ncbi:CdaR family protein [Pullulanibacillus sp. KACC 23026]|uniref:CdaR family protein n=1 Tax=Pullulanibacillus sp. KACC 23026 TaxID=3028315 RepID=UPI0023AE8F03|nr:CdaR family protein [Pullulanibacillus sp. KACC 23026]WEG12613.1 CdaR family protein [Pullulanibacillus sp. KACC 23026]
MDRLFRNSWFIRIISFLIALMLYTMVTAEQPTKNSTAVLLGTNDQSTTINETLDAKYDKDKEILYGLPDTVQIQVKGNSEEILKTKYTTTKSVYIDLTGKSPGTYKVHPEVSGFPSGVKLNIVPSTVTVTLEKKVTKTLPISVDLLNKGSLPAGYKLGTPVLSPKEVTVTGGQKLVDSISFVKGVLNAQDVTGAVNQQVPLNAYDENGNQLDVTLNPAVVRIKIPVVSPSKVVPIDIQPTGSPPDGESIKSVTLSSETVQIFGSHDVIDGIDSIHDIPLNLGNLNKSNQVDIKIPVPNGAEKVNPAKVTATVQFEKTVTKKISDIPIIVNDSTSKSRDVSFNDPQNRTVDVTISGAKSIISQIKSSDLKVVINIGSLSTGEHVVPILLTTPDFVDGVLSQTTADIVISNSSSGQ